MKCRDCGGSVGAGRPCPRCAVFKEWLSEKAAGKDVPASVTLPPGGPRRRPRAVAWAALTAVAVLTSLWLSGYVHVVRDYEMVYPHRGGEWHATIREDYTGRMRATVYESGGVSEVKDYAEPPRHSRSSRLRVYWGPDVKV